MRCEGHFFRTIHLISSFSKAFSEKTIPDTMHSTHASDATRKIDGQITTQFDFYGVMAFCLSMP